VQQLSARSEPFWKSNSSAVPPSGQPIDPWCNL